MFANRRKHRTVRVFPLFTPYRREKKAEIDLCLVASCLTKLRAEGNPLYKECKGLHKFCEQKMRGRIHTVSLRLVAYQTVKNDEDEDVDIFQAVYNDGTRLHMFRVSEKCLAGRRKEAVREQKENWYSLFCLLPDIAGQSVVYSAR